MTYSLVRDNSFWRDRPIRVFAATIGGNPQQFTGAMEKTNRLMPIRIVRRNPKFRLDRSPDLSESKGPAPRARNTGPKGVFTTPASPHTRRAMKRGPVWKGLTQSYSPARLDRAGSASAPLRGRGERASQELQSAELAPASSAYYFSRQADLTECVGYAQGSERGIPRFCLGMQRNGNRIERKARRRTLAAVENSAAAAQAAGQAQGAQA
jgi:hypothetical protein